MKHTFKLSIDCANAAFCEDDTRFELRGRLKGPLLIRLDHDIARTQALHDVGQKSRSMMIRVDNQHPFHHGLQLRQNATIDCKQDADLHFGQSCIVERC